MYYGKKEIFNPEKREKYRNEVVSYRSGAISNAFLELEGILNKSELARQYFEKSQSWISQKINGCNISGRGNQEFNVEEARKLVAAFRDIAYRLNGLADEIEKVIDID